MAAAGGHPRRKPTSLRLHVDLPALIEGGRHHATQVCSPSRQREDVKREIHAKAIVAGTDHGEFSALQPAGFG